MANNYLTLPIPAIFSSTLGVPLEGGKIHTYVNKTTTPQATYKDAARTTPHTNPIILNANGRPATDDVVWLTPGLQYTIKVTNAADVDVWEADNISAGEGGGGGQTPREAAAAIDPTNTSYLEGHYKRYGAIGDGVTVDTAAVQQAHTLGGVLDSGGITDVYLVDATIDMVADTHLTGRGTIKCISTTIGIMRAVGSIDAPLDNIVIDGVTFQGAAPGLTTAETGSLLLLRDCTNSHVRNCYFDKANQAALEMTRCINSDAENCVATDSGLGWETSSGGYGFISNSGQDVAFRNCYVRRCGTHAFNGFRTLRWVMEGCNAEETGYALGTISASDTPVFTLTSLTQTAGLATAITSIPHDFKTGDWAHMFGAVETGYNIIVPVTRTGTTSFTFPVASGTASPATTGSSLTCRNVSGRDAVIRGNRGVRLGLYGTVSGGSGVVVENGASGAIVTANQISGVSTTFEGINISDGATGEPSEDVHVTDNRIIDVGGSGIKLTNAPRAVCALNTITNMGYEGIIVTGVASAKTKITGNTISGTGLGASVPVGIGVGIRGTTITNLTISNNTIRDTYRHGILLEAATSEVRVVDNDVFNPDTDAAGSNSGISLGSTVTDCTVSDNVVDGEGGTAPYGIFFTSGSTGNRGNANVVRGVTTATINYQSPNNLLTKSEVVDTVTSQLSADTTVGPTQARVFLFDPNTSGAGNRNVTPTGAFGYGHVIIIVNTGPPGETLTFDPGSLANVIDGGESRMYTYTAGGATLWKHIALV